MLVRSTSTTNHCSHLIYIYISIGLLSKTGSTWTTDDYFGVANVCVCSPPSIPEGAVMHQKAYSQPPEKQKKKKCVWACMLFGQLSISQFLHRCASLEIIHSDKASNKETMIRLAANIQEDKVDFSQLMFSKNLTLFPVLVSRIGECAAFDWSDVKENNKSCPVSEIAIRFFDNQGHSIWCHWIALWRWTGLPSASYCSPVLLQIPSEATSQHGTLLWIWHVLRNLLFFRKWMFSSVGGVRLWSLLSLEQEIEDMQISTWLQREIPGACSWCAGLRMAPAQTHALLSFENQSTEWLEKHKPRFHEHLGLKQTTVVLIKMLIIFWILDQ